MILTGKTQQEVDSAKQQSDLKQELATLQAYLDSTDWYVTRKMERDISIPVDVSAERLIKINRINEIKALV